MDFRLTLIPLEHAVRAVYEQLHGEVPKPVDDATAKELDDIRSAMLRLVPVYEYDSDPDITARPLLQPEADGRPSDVPLAVSVNDIPKVVAQLKKK